MSQLQVALENGLNLRQALCLRNVAKNEHEGIKSSQKLSQIGVSHATAISLAAMGLVIFKKKRIGFFSCLSLTYKGYEIARKLLEKEGIEIINKQSVDNKALEQEL
jgi:hypothetical protein